MPEAASAETATTLGSCCTSASMARSQWLQLMPVTLNRWRRSSESELFCMTFLSRVRASRSGSNEASDGRGSLGHLLVCGASAGGGGVGDTMGQVLVEQLEGDRLERLGGGGDLVEDVDAVLVLLDHPLEPAYLAFDPPETLLNCFLLVGVTGHGDTLPP